MSNRDTFDRFAPPDRGLFGDNESDERAPRITGKSDLHDFTVALHHETQVRNPDAGAVLVSNDGEEKKAVWIPKSAAEIVREGKFTQGHLKSGKAVKLPLIVITIPERVAVEKGLL